MNQPDQKILVLLQQIIESQHKKLYALGQQIVPHLTTDDLLQPNDFPQLENHPEFRYEEGILEGMHTIQAALYAHFKKT